MKNCVKKGLIFSIIFTFISSILLQSVVGDHVLRNHQISSFSHINLNDGETEYWGVCIVAFDGPYDDIKEPFIYNSLLESDNWDESNLKLLFRENATKIAILDALDWLIEKADENDIVLFSDHSHGAYHWKNKNFGIVPIDSEVSGLITVDELDEKFDAIKSKGLCLIFDCCLAGNFVNKETLGIKKIDKIRNFNREFTKGVEGENRVVLMGTMRYGLGIGMTINVSGKATHLSFHKFVGEAFGELLDYNENDFFSAEEAFKYAKKKWLPYALMSLLMIRMQINSLLNFGFLIIPFPTLYDNVQGELPIINL